MNELLNNNKKFIWELGSVQFSLHIFLPSNCTDQKVLDMHFFNVLKYLKEKKGNCFPQFSFWLCQDNVYICLTLKIKYHTYRFYSLFRDVNFSLFSTGHAFLDPNAPDPFSCTDEKHKHGVSVSNVRSVIHIFVY